MVSFIVKMFTSVLLATLLLMCDIAFYSFYGNVVAIVVITVVVVVVFVIKYNCLQHISLSTRCLCQVKLFFFVFFLSLFFFCKQKKIKILFLLS